MGSITWQGVAEEKNSILGSKLQGWTTKNQITNLHPDPSALHKMRVKSNKSHYISLRLKGRMLSMNLNWLIGAKNLWYLTHLSCVGWFILTWMFLFIPRSFYAIYTRSQSQFSFSEIQADISNCFLNISLQICHMLNWLLFDWLSSTWLYQLNFLPLFSNNIRVHLN